VFPAHPQVTGAPFTALTLLLFQLLERSSAHESPDDGDDGEEEISAAQHHGEAEGSARPPTGESLSSLDCLRTLPCSMNGCLRTHNSRHIRPHNNVTHMTLYHVPAETFTKKTCQVLENCTFSPIVLVQISRRMKWKL